MASLGTGAHTRPLSYERVRGWGRLQWAQPILDVVFDGIADTSEWELRRLCRSSDDGNPSYHRLQSPLRTAAHALDDASADNVARLLADAETLIDEEQDTLTAICDAIEDVAADRRVVSRHSHRV
jgi:hypothetical protein